MAKKCKSNKITASPIGENLKLISKIFQICLLKNAHKHHICKHFHTNYNNFCLNANLYQTLPSLIFKVICLRILLTFILQTRQTTKNKLFPEYLTIFRSIDETKSRHLSRSSRLGTPRPGSSGS